jgi:glycosyltransferase involved in cell wall biosynthesis
MVILAEPAAGAVPSGGYRYNRRVSEELPRERFLRRELKAPAALAQLPGRAGLRETDALLVDSLYLHHPEQVVELRERYHGALWLLLHYLPSLDPLLPADEARRLRHMEARCLASADGAVVTGAFTARSLQDYPQAPGRVVIAPPGVERRFFAPRPQRRNTGPVRMITVANWTPLKNHAALLPVLAELRAQPWIWSIIGDCRPQPGLCRSFREEAQRLGLAGRIELKGPAGIEQVAQALREADLCLSPSLLESYGMSIAEAMAAGCAVVAAARGGALDLIADGETGRLCDPERRGCWHSVLEQLLRRPEERRRLGTAAREWAERFPGWRESAERLLAGIEGRSVA